MKTDNKTEEARPKRYRTRRAWGIALIVCGLVFGSGVMASAGTLSVTGYAQPKDSNWCWAAASQMIIKYLTGNKVDQCKLVKDGLASSRCPLDQGGTKAQVNRALSTNGVKSGNEVTLTWSKLRGQVDAKQPVYTSIRYAKGGGHALVLKGYYAGPEGSYVYYINPTDAGSVTKYWPSFVSNSRYSMGTSLVDLKKK